MINGLYEILMIKISGTFFPIGCLSSNGIQESAETINTTTRQNTNGWRTMKATGQTYSLPFDGLIKYSDLTNLVSYRDIEDLKRARNNIEWKLENLQDGTVDYGDGLITSLQRNAATDEYISFSGTIEGYGEPLKEVNSLYLTSDYVDVDYVE